jgi:hypothetical protein
MADLRHTPSVQHAVALIGRTVEQTIRNFERLEKVRGLPSLAPGRRLVKPLMEGYSLEWALKQCEGLKVRDRAANKNLLTAFAPYAAGKSVRWFRPYPLEPYPIGQGVVIPLNPYGFWSDGSRLHLLWVQSWKDHTLDDLQKAILYTMFEQRIFVGEFKNAEFEWVDLREKKKGGGRDREVLYRSNFNALTASELKYYIDILYSAFREYDPARRQRQAAEKASQSHKRKDDGQQELPV